MLDINELLILCAKEATYISMGPDSAYQKVALSISPLRYSKEFYRISIPVKELEIAPSAAEILQAANAYCRNELNEREAKEEATKKLRERYKDKLKLIKIHRENAQLATCLI